MNDKLIILQSKKRGFFERALAAFSFAVVLYVPFLFFFNKPILFTEEYFKSFAALLELIIFIGTLGVYYSYQIHHHFNLKEKKYRLFFTIGPFGYGIWKNMNKLSYVAVNEIKSQDVFEINIWDEHNHRYKVGYFDNLEDAKKTSLSLAEKFEVEFYEKDE